MATVEHETYYITAEQMATVTTYIPLRAKTEWVAIVADKCFDVMNITASLDEEALPLPAMYKENSETKSRYLMGVFVKLYLHGSWEVGEDEDPWLMPIDEYDKWAGGHIFSQIEKFKSDKELRDICFNLLADYKDIERRLNTEIHGMLQAMNDPAARQMAAMQMSMTPEAMEKALEGLTEAKDALSEYMVERDKATAEAEESAEAEEQSLVAEEKK